MKLVPEWKECLTLRTISSFCLALVAAAQGAWIGLPPQWTATIPQEWVMWGTAAIAVLGFVGRLLDGRGAK